MNLIRHLLTLIRGESPEQMRERINNTSFLRSVFWQGANGGMPPDASLDRKLQVHLVDHQFKALKLGGLFANGFVYQTER